MTFDTFDQRDEATWQWQWQIQGQRQRQIHGEHLQRAILVTCDIWDTDYISDNWELDFLTIFVTWQLRVTLDSIRNSCDVYSMIITFHKTRGVHCIIQRDLVKNARRWTVPVYIWCILQQIENDLYKIGRPNLKNEWKLIPWNVFEPLAYALTHLSAFGPVVVHLPGENSILPYCFQPWGTK